MSQEVRLKDIAREANLSVAAVSKALAGHPHVNETTRRRVLTISEQLKYKPRPRKRSQDASRQRRAAFMLIEVDRMADYRDQWLTGVTSAAQKYDIRLELNGIERLTGEWRASLRKAVTEMDALLLVGAIKPVVLDAALELDVPCVVLGDVQPEPLTPTPTVHCVNTDKLAMGRSATQALIDAGHERIGFFCAPFPVGGWNDQWLSGYRLALMRAGLPDDAAIRPVLETENRDEVGAEAARYMAALDNPPTAFVSPTMRGAARFRETMAEHGIDISPDRMVIGGREEERSDYGLQEFPVVSENPSHLALRAVNLLSRLADGEDLPPAEIIVPHTFCNVESLSPSAT